VRFLVDQNLSPRVAALLVAHGHDAVHTPVLGLQTASDQVVLSHARDDNRVLVSADSDFGTILAATRAETPPVIYVRRTDRRRADQIAELLVANLKPIEEALIEGSLVVLGDGTIRIRRLPIL